MKIKKHSFSTLSTFIYLLVLLIFCSVQVYAEGRNLIDSTMALESQNWIKYSQNNYLDTEILLDDSEKHSQNSSIRITNNSADYSTYTLTINLDKNSEYKLSSWVKTKNVGIDNTGACLSIEGMDIAAKEGTYIKPLSNNGVPSFRYIKTNPSKTGPRHISSTDLTGNNGIWQNLQLHIKTGQSTGTVKISFELGRPGKENTGTAWFDDLAVEKVNAGTYRASAVILQSSIFVLVIVIFATVLYARSKSSKSKNRNKKSNIVKADLKFNNQKIIIFSVFGLAIIFRIILSAVIEGHVLDIYCFKTWSSVAAENLFNIYSSGVFIDYPPFYIYILFIIGKAASLFNLYTIPWLYSILLKLPSTFAEIATGIIIYKTANSRFTFKMSMLLTSLYLFSATLFLDTYAWGQVDSFFAFIITIALIYLYKGNYALSSVFFTIAVLTKPQGIIFLPILFFELVRSKKIKNFIYSFLCMFSTAILIVLPFSIKEGTLWIIKLYKTTLSEYTAVVQGAYNLFAFLGGTDKDDYEILLFFSYKTWGFIFIVLVTCFVWYLYIKSKEDFIPLLGALVIMTGVYMLSSRMHERYLLPALVIALVLFIYSKDKRILLLYGCFSLTLYESIDTGVFRMLDLPIQFMSFINLVLFAWLIKISLNIAVKGKIESIELKKPVTKNLIADTKTKRQNF